MDTQTVKELILCLKNYNARDKGLDGRIFCEVEGREWQRLEPGKIGGRRREPSHDTCLILKDGKLIKCIPPYTKLLDSALTLVPKDFVWTVSRDEISSYATVRSRGPDIFVSLSGPTPAVAMCLAALQAQLLEQEPRGQQK